MNKSLLIVLLAVCLVSVHAFVKRDAPAPAATESSLGEFQKNLENFAEGIKKNFEGAFNPDAIKKGFSDAIDKVSETFKQSKTTS